MLMAGAVTVNRGPACLFSRENAKKTQKNVKGEQNLQMAVRGGSIRPQM
jgi:hypothetical protein